MHYVGDKLAALTRAAGWLADDGLLVADLDLASIRLPDGRPDRPLPQPRAADASSHPATAPLHM